MWKKEPPTADEVRARMDAWGLAWAPYIARSLSGVLVMQEQLTVCDGVVVQLYGVSQLPHGREWYAVPTPDEVAAREEEIARLSAENAAQSDILDEIADLLPQRGSEVMERREIAPAVAALRSERDDALNATAAIDDCGVPIEFPPVDSDGKGYVALAYPGGWSADNAGELMTLRQRVEWLAHDFLRLKARCEAMGAALATVRDDAESRNYDRDGLLRACQPHAIDAAAKVIEAARGFERARREFVAAMNAGRPIGELVDAQEAAARRTIIAVRALDGAA